MFNDVSYQTILIKLFEMLSKRNEPAYQKAAPLGFDEPRARLCAWRENDATLCLRLEYNQGQYLNSQPVMKYHWGWQLAEDYINVTQAWLDQVHKLEAPDA